MVETPKGVWSMDQWDGLGWAVLHARKFWIFLMVMLHFCAFLVTVEQSLSL